MNMDLTVYDIVRVKTQWADCDDLHVDGMDCMLGKLLLISRIHDDGAFRAFNEPVYWYHSSCVEEIILQTEMINIQDVCCGDFVIVDNTLLRVLEVRSTPTNEYDPVLLCADVNVAGEKWFSPIEVSFAFRSSDVQRYAPLNISAPTGEELLSFLFGAKEEKHEL